MIAIKKFPSAPLLCLLPTTAAGAAFNNTCNTFTNKPETMRRSAFMIFLFVFLSVFLLATFSLNYYSSSGKNFYGAEIVYHYANLTTRTAANSASHIQVIAENLHSLPRRAYSVLNSSSFDSVSILLPDWEVLVVVPREIQPELISGENFTCFYPNNSTSPARFSGVLPSTNQTTFKCELPPRCRQRFPFLSPVLTSSGNKESQVLSPREMLRWNYLVYESTSTENDVVLFVKGLNNRQGINRSPNDLNCVFFVEDDVSGNIINAVRTSVTSSVQEVLRCQHPDLTAFGSGGVDRIKLKVSLESSVDKKVMPSVAYYAPRRMLANPEAKSQICACTMVYNVAKFLREWVIYHSKIGVEKFILYDNESDDDLERVVKELNNEGFNVEILLWMWPKTQEAGFSHATLYAKNSCNWIMYVDVDEFVFVPSWENFSLPSDQMIQSLLPRNQNNIGQVSIKCYEFGPSNQKSHPVDGVTQGYNCRRKVENRHKSIVLIDAIHDSLFNAIHHFQLKEMYRTKQVSLKNAVVNHYKYQAWSEFKAKFRRRVSAYVVDWRQEVNPLSKDRTPGLGFEAVEPAGWEQKFCQVRDDRLKLLMQRWFGRQTETGYKMAWQ